MRGYVIFLIIILLIIAFTVYSIISAKKAKLANKESWLMTNWSKPSIKAITSSLIAVLGGLIIGCIVLLCFVNKEVNGSKISLHTAFEGIELILFGPFAKGRENSNLIYGFNGATLGDVLFKATPLLLTGLSVAVAFKTGLFNIGAPGQYLLGTAVTIILALTIPTSVVPAWIVWIIAFLGGILGGALWGFIPGIFKALLNVNEVITCIMTNWIAANLVSALFDKTTGPFKFLLDPSGTKNNSYLYKTTHNGVATSKMGLDYIFKGSQINGGIIIAILIAVLVYIIMNKTTFGYELKACGSNRNASKYAGINEKRSIILSMVIAGALTGAGSALYFLSGNTEFYANTSQSLPAVGFNGIPVALLAMNNPIGVIFSASFLSYLDVAGLQLKNFTGYNEHLASIISAIIVYFSAFSLLINSILRGTYNKKFHKIGKSIKEFFIKIYHKVFKKKEVNLDNKEEDK